MDPSKRSAVHQIHSQYVNVSTPFGYLYGAQSLDDSYHLLMTDYFQCFDRIQYAANSMKLLKSEKSEKSEKSMKSKNGKNSKNGKSGKSSSEKSKSKSPPSTAPIPSSTTTTNNGLHKISDLDNSKSPEIDPEPILKHYISNYAVPPPLGDEDGSNRLATPSRNESFCLLPEHESTPGIGMSFCVFRCFGRDFWWKML